MIPISESIQLNAPVQLVWPHLADPQLVASCVPGATLEPKPGAEGVYLGTIQVKLGPTQVRFGGEVELRYDHDKRICVISGRGRDGRGASNVRATGEMTAQGDADTTIAIKGEFDLTGPLAGFARTGGVHIARAMLAEFGARLTRRIEAQMAGTGLDPTGTGDDVSVSGMAIAKGAIGSWMKTKFSKSGSAGSEGE